MSSLHKVFVAFAAASLSVAAASAHGGEQAGGDDAAGKRGDAKKVTRTVTVNAQEYDFGVGGPGMTFKLGETVKFVVANKGTLMHEFTIGTEAQQAEHQKMMAGMSDKDHADAAHDDGDMDAMAANAVHVRPGESKELIWTFTHAGNFTFACNFPGHATLGMEGKITVQ